MPDFPGRPNVFSLPVPYSIRIGSRLLDLSRTRVMGILNATPDSFFAGSRVGRENVLLDLAEKMLSDGAAILDIGAMSSRPGAKEIPVKEELERLLPSIRSLVRSFPEVILSVDCYRSEVAEAAIQEGASILNDITGGSGDQNLLSLAAKHKLPYISMHSRGTLDEMHRPNVYQNLTVEIITELQEKIFAAREAGVRDVIADPGFGFSKAGDQNFELLRNLNAFEILDCPLLVGISRKSMISKTLGISSEESLNGTTALHMIALQQGAHILRVHDVREAAESIKLFEKLCSPEL
jgi:dihydropteroate synthase